MDKMQKHQDKRDQQEQQRLERLKFREETAKNYTDIKKQTPLYKEKADQFDSIQQQVEQEKLAMVPKKERVELDSIKSHMKQFEELRSKQREQINSERKEQIQQQRKEAVAIKHKLMDFRTQFSDRVLEENQRLKAKITEDFDSKLLNQQTRKEYASSVKKPRIDENLKDKLLNEIKHPTTFMGR